MNTSSPAVLSPSFSRKWRKRPAILAASIGALLALAAAVHPASAGMPPLPEAEAWLGGTDGTWTGNNWASDAGGTIIAAIPTALDDLTFSATGAANRSTTLGQDFTIHSLTISDPLPVTIDSGLSGPFTLTISGNAGTGLDVQAGAGLVTIGANLTLAGLSDTITVNNAAGAVINGSLGGGNGLIKLGSGTLTLAGANSYSGGTTIRGGVVAVTAGGAINHGSADLTIGQSSGDSATLNVSGGSVTNQTGFLGYSAGSVGTATVSSGTWANSVNLAVGRSGTGTLNVNGGSVTNSYGYLGFNAGSVGTATVSSGTWANSGDLYVGNRGTGTLNVSGGSVTNTTGILGVGAGSVGTATVSSGTWANSGDLHVGYQGTGTLTMSGGLVSVAGTLTQGTSGTINLNAGGTLQIGVGGADGVLGVAALTNNGTLIFNRSNASTYSGSISGSGAVTKQGAGTLTLAGANSYSGGTTISGGVVAVTAGGAISHGSANLTIGQSSGDSGTLNVTGGSVTNQDGVLGLSAGGVGTATVSSGTWANSGDLYVGYNGTGVLNLSDTGVVTVGAGSGTLTVANMTGSHGTLNIGTGGAAGTLLAGVVTGGAGSASVNFKHTDTAFNFAPILAGTLSVAHSGPGTTIFAQSNTYTGGTTVTSGTLQTGNASALGTGAVSLQGGVLAASGTLGVDALNWGAGKLQLAPAAGDIVHVTNALTNTGGGGAFNIDATGLTPGTYTLATFGSTNFVQPDFTATFLNTGGLTFVGNLLLSASDVKLTLNGVIATGNVIQNSVPVGTPTFADFLINGAVTTGGPTDNTVAMLTFLPGGSLRINNTLFVTGGPVNLGDGSSIQLNGILAASQLNMFTNSLLSGNGGINGNLVNNGVVSPGNSPGSIRVSGNYTQSRTGTLRIEVGGTSAADYDRLIVGGTAQLDGELQLVKLNRFEIKRGDKITILTAAGGVHGEFATVSSNPFDTILEPTVVYGDTTVSLEVVRGSFEKYAAHGGLTPNQRAVAGALDSVSADKPNDAALVYLDQRQLSQLPGDFEKIAPEELTSIFAISTSLATVQSINLQRRTEDLRQGASGFSASGLAMQGTGPGYSGSLNGGVAGPRGQESKELKAVAPEEKKWGAFVTGVGEWVDVGGDGNARGYDITTGGFTLGLDYKVTPNFAVGISAGYAGTAADLNDGGDVRVNGGKLGVYATFWKNTGGEAGPTGKETKDGEMPVSLGGTWYVDAAVTGGYNSYDTKRAALQGTARGDTDGGELNVLVGTGFDIRFGSLTIGPTATFQSMLVGIDGFTETGSLAPLRINSRNAESVRAQLGFKASYDWKVGGVLVRPEIRASWQHEFGDSSYALDASFSNGAGNNFLVNGPELGRDSLLLGAGVAIQCSEWFSIYFYYDGEVFRERYDRHGVSGGVRIAF